MADRTVWAFKRIPQLNFQVGYVQCDEDLAQELMDSGEAQDPKCYGSTMKYIDETYPEIETQTKVKRERKYKTKELVAGEDEEEEKEDE